MSIPLNVAISIITELISNFVVDMITGEPVADGTLPPELIKEEIAKKKPEVKIPQPQKIYKPSKSVLPSKTSLEIPKLPPRKLPKEADGQTAFETPAGESLSINESLNNKTLGKLLVTPYVKESITLKVDSTGIFDKYEQSKSEAVEAFTAKMIAKMSKHQLLEPYQEAMDKLLDSNEPAWALTTGIIAPKMLNPNAKELGLITGYKPLLIAQRYFHDQSTQGESEVHGKIIKEENNIKTVTFETSSIIPNFDNFAFNTNGIADIHAVLGRDNFPFTVPRFLLNVQNESASIENGQLVVVNDYSELIKWLVMNIDALIGEFPIKINIKDIDPNTNGEQFKEIELPNIAETLAEMYGLLRFNAETGGLNQNILLRMIPELLSVKASSIVTQDVVKANAQFLGYRSSPKNNKITNNFNLKDIDNFEKLLKEQEVSVVGFQCDEKDSVADYLQKLMFAAGIIKAVYFRKIDDPHLPDVANKYKTELENLDQVYNNYDKNDPNNQNWENFKNMINNEKSGWHDKNVFPKIKEENAQ